MALTPKNSTESVYLNEQKYSLVLTLVNPEGREFIINTGNLVELKIIDDGLLWYKTGTLVIENPENILEKRPNSLVPVNANYVFRNDCKDLLYLKLTAIKDTDGLLGAIDEKLLNMEYVFSVYDKKEIPGSDSTRNKLLQLFFWELDYQIFYETNLDWSTNTLLKTKTLPYLLSDEDRKVYTGEAIKGLLKTTLLLEDNAFSNEWDRGSSKIFYNSLANNNAIDDLEYLLGRHVGTAGAGQTAGDPCLLIRNRFRENKWSLISLSKLYGGSTINKTYAGSLYTETFVIAGPSQSTETSIPSLDPVPISDGDKIIYSSPTNSIITSFQFEDMSGLDNVKLVINLPCYYNDIKNKTFGVDFADNTVEAVKDYIQKNYVNKILSTATSTITVNDVKAQIKTVKQAYSFQNNKTARYADSRNKLIRAMMYFNQNITFNVPGSIFRESNTFIGIKRSQNVVENNFDNKMLGQWMIDKVEHRITKDAYSNTIYAVKPHSNDTLLTR